VSNQESTELPRTTASQPPGPSRRVSAYLRREWPALTACLLLSVVLSVLAIQWSSQYGKLTHDIQFDDVLHFVDGMNLYLVAQQGGMSAALEQFGKNPTLAPLSTLAVAGSFQIFGVQPWAPYVANAIVLLFALCAVWFLTSRFPSWVRVASIIWFLSVPIAWSALGDFKPNLFSSLLMLLGMFALLEWWLLEGPRSLLPISAACVAFSILAKPPFFPFAGVTLWLFAASLILLRRFALRRSWFPEGSGWRTYLLAIGVGLLLLAPYAVTGGPIVWKMLMDHIAPGGEFNDVWTTTFVRRNIWLYFFTGHGGIMLGAQLWFGLLLWGAAIAALLRSTRTYQVLVVAILWLLLLAYLPPTLTEVKHRFTGLLFQLLFILSPVYLLAFRFSETKSEGARKIAMGSVAGIAVVSLMFADPIRGLGGDLYPPGQGEEQRAITRQLLDKIQTETTGKAQPQLVLFTTGLINSNTLDWVAMSENYSIDIPPSGNIVTLRKTDRATRNADFILAADPDALGTYGWHPLTKNSSEMFAWLRESGEFELVEQVPTSSGGSFKLYQRTSTRSPALENQP